MKKKMISVFVGACLAVCLIPSVLMFVDGSDDVIGNETAAELPAIADAEGTFNSGILGDLGTYFEKHFAFRPQLITADAKIQAGVFQTSNTDTVTVGKEGWLYYTSTLNDYLGKKELSNRGKWALAHNLKLVENYVEENGAKFLFMVPPNKNSLYGEHMPYYYRAPLAAGHNRDGLQENLMASEVSYLDLFSLFEAQQEVLYLKQDSHWNNKGALLVYNAALDRLDKTHEDYSEVNVTRANTHLGDLSAMIYPASEEMERDYTYDYTQNFEYQITAKTMSDTVSVEDYHIEAKNPAAEESLLMYRDSFGNTLIPFLANAFADSCFSKAVPYNLAGDMSVYCPDYVIIEKVERNLKDYVTEPAILPAPAVSVDKTQLTAVAQPELSVEQCMANMLYASFRGVLPADGLSETARIYMGIPDAMGNEMLYEMFTTVTDESDYGYLAYLPLERFGDLSNIPTEKINIYIEK